MRHRVTEEQVGKAYKVVFDDNLRRYGGTEALETFKDKKTAAAFADTLFMHGAKGGAEIVKSACGPAERVADSTPGNAEI